MAPLVRLVQRWSGGFAEFRADDLQATRRGAADQAEVLSELSHRTVEQVAVRTAAEALARPSSPTG
jgi:hypothetical protein